MKKFKERRSEIAVERAKKLNKILALFLLGFV